MIAASSMLSPCQIFTVAHYSKRMKDIIFNLGIVSCHDEAQLEDKGHYSDSYMFRVMPHFSIKLLSKLLKTDKCWHRNRYSCKYVFSHCI